MKFQELAKFQPKQLEAIKKLFNNQTKYLLYGGAAGGGKSYFLRWCAVRLAMYYAIKYKITGIPIGLFSEDYPTLRDRQIIKIKHEFPPFLGELRESRDEGLSFILAQRFGGGVVLLRNLDDPSKYASAEFAAILVEELTKNPIETFEDLRFRLRYPGIDEVKFVGTTNPGGIGHAWVKKLWIDPDPQNEDKEQSRFIFVPANVYDNEFVSKEYITQLKSLPEAKRKAWLEGSWDIFEGQVFSEWNRNSHVVTPFPIPKEWKRYIALDWGVNKPFAVIWFAQNFDGRVYTYRELYLNGDQFEVKFGKPLTPKRLANIIKKTVEKAGEDYQYLVADPSIWNNAYFGKGAKAIEGGESIAEAMTNVGLKMIRGDNDRFNGMARVREYLSLAPDGLPWWQVFANCYDTIRTIPSLIYDKNQVEDVDTDGEDHVYDGTRYFFMSRPSRPARVKEPTHNPIKQLLRRQIYDYESSEREEYGEENEL